MNITSSILLLLLACSVASLMVSVTAPNIPPGQPLGVLTYSVKLPNLTKTQVVSGVNL